MMAARPVDRKLPANEDSMADIINLKDIRKARARALTEAKASENRARFGRTRDERTRQNLEDSRARREHDGNRLERPSTDDAEKPSGGPGKPESGQS
jgi:hypothetical protein